MTEVLSILVVPTAWGERLKRSVEAALAQTDPDVEVLVVDAGGPEARARAAAEAYARTSGLRVVEARREGENPWVDGARAARGRYVVPVAEGDLLEPEFCADARRAVTEDPALGYVLAPGVMEPGGAPVLPELPLEWSAAVLLSATWCAPVALMVRRDLFEAAAEGQRFGTLSTYAWLLGLLDQDARGRLLPRPGLRHLATREAAFRAALDPDRYRAAVAALLERHRDRFERDPAVVLFGRERLLRELVGQHRARVERRDADLARLQAVVHEVGRLRTWLEQEGRAGFEWGDFERTSPVSRDWGYDRGTPVDRYYIEQFIARHAADVQGRVLEVQDNDLTVRFGDPRVSRSDVVDWNPGNPRATIVDDLRCAATVADDTYDCIILTQTLHVIDDMRAVLAQCGRILKAGGVLLATLPTASRVCLEYGPAGDFWRVTEAGARAVFEEVFPPACVQTSAFGNVKVAAAFLYGLAAHEVDLRSFETVDPYFPLIVGVRAVKPAGWTAPAVGPGLVERSRREPAPASGAILLYHRVARAASDVHGLCVDPDDFARQMGVLRDRFTPLALGEFVEALRQGALPPRAVAVTFDDGYVEVLREALPILEATSVPATCFVPSGVLEAPGEFWWDILERALLGPHRVPPQLSLAAVGLTLEAETATPEARRRAHDEVYRLLRRSSASIRDRAIAYLVTWSGAAAVPQGATRPMTRGEVARLAESTLVTIGAHGARHLPLPELSEEEQRQEIATSKRALEAATGRAVDAFAYPYGAWDVVTARLVREAGFRCALTCDEAPARPGRDPWRLPRFEVRPEVGSFFERRLHALLGRRRG